VDGSKYLVAVAIAYCLATVGERIVGRRSSGLVGWNVSFLVGVSFVATLFFPLSIMLPATALTVTAAALMASGCVRLASGATPAPKERWSLPESWISRIFLGVVVLACIQFVAQNHRVSYFWDGYQIWATKALALYEHGALSKQVMTPAEILNSLPACCDGSERTAFYPQMVPLLEALLSKLRGAFDWIAVKAIFPLFLISMLISAYQGARVFVPQAAALGACALLVLLPGLVTHLNVGGYADMPQAALAGAAVANLLDRRGTGQVSFRLPAVWILSGVMLVKSEGMILFGVASLIVLAVWAFGGIRHLVHQAQTYRSAIGVALACAALRVYYLRWTESSDLTYGPIDAQHLAEAWNRLVAVPRLCLPYIIDPNEWGVFWPAVGVAVAILVWMGGKQERGLAIGTVLAGACYTGIFYFTNWDIKIHIEQAYTRLLSHLAPAAAISLAAAYGLLFWGRTPARDTAASRDELPGSAGAEVS
jgi:hypothetical protein